MAVASLPEVLDPAFRGRYGVAAFNVVNDLTMEAVICAAAELESPVIVQTSLKTVQAVGATPLASLFRSFADAVEVPVALHLDHCPDPQWVSICLSAGWNSVLFDGSHLDLADNTRQTARIVAEARQHGAHVEGEIEGVRGVEDGVGRDDEGRIHPLEVSRQFIEDTGVYCFAPAIGTAHGMYLTEPKLMPERVSGLVELQAIPMVLHGGTGLGAEAFRDLIARGCSKINISTALKIAFVDAHREYLVEHDLEHDPLSLLGHVRARVVEVARHHVELFGSAGKTT